MTNLEKYNQVFMNVLGVHESALNEAFTFKDVPQWDSVGNLAIIRTIEQELNVEFPLEDLFDLTSVQSIVDEVNSLRS